MMIVTDRTSWSKWEFMVLDIAGKRDSGSSNSTVSFLPTSSTGTATGIRSLAGDLPGQYNILSPAGAKMTPDDPAADDEFTLAVAQKSLVRHAILVHVHTHNHSHNHSHNHLPLAFTIALYYCKIMRHV
jgi:hypothetical protein